MNSSRRLLLTLALLLAALPAWGDISGSTITRHSPDVLALGEYVPLRLRVENTSSDFNWIGRINLRLPLCCTVVAMSYDDTPSNGQWVFETQGIPGWDVSYIDGAGDEWGEIPGGDWGYLDLLVNVSESCGAGNTLQVWYDLVGDGFGAEPHELDNQFFTIDFDYVPVDGAHFSTLKALY